MESPWKSEFSFPTHRERAIRKIKQEKEKPSLRCKKAMNECVSTSVAEYQSIGVEAQVDLLG